MITLFHAYARSGGTLLNRLLAAMKDVVVMSEVLFSEKGSTIPSLISGGVCHQALYWYDIRLKNKEYIPSILELEEVCQKSGRHLVIREWTFGCYLWQEESFPPHIKPPYGLYTFRHLPREKIQPFALTRNALDVCKSYLLTIVSSFKPENEQQFNKAYSSSSFTHHYLDYACDIAQAGIPFYRYEDLLEAPETFLRQLCQDMNIPFDRSACTRFADVILACGDIGIHVQGRYARKKTIQPQRKHLFPYQQENSLRQDAKLIEANRLLGYQTEAPLTPTHRKRQNKTYDASRSSFPPLCLFYEHQEQRLWGYPSLFAKDAHTIPPRPPVLTASVTSQLQKDQNHSDIDIIFHARHIDEGCLTTLKYLTDIDIPYRIIIITAKKPPMSLKERLPHHSIVLALGNNITEFPTTCLAPLHIMRMLMAQNTDKALFLCSKHMVILSPRPLQQLLAYSGTHTITACSYGPNGIDPYPILIRPSGDQHDITILMTRGADDTPFTNRQILFNDNDTQAENHHQPFNPRIAMDFVHNYPQLIQRPFINWKKTYADDETVLFVSADEYIKTIAHPITQRTYGMLTQCFISKKPYQNPYIQPPIRKYLLKIYWIENWLKKKAYWLKRKNTLKNSIAKRLGRLS